MSLRQMSLKDFVIVSSLELDFKNGFSVLTGETGAGKSILIDALQLCLGSRADANMIREGASKTEICAEFDTPAGPHALLTWLEEGGFEAQDVLLLKRTIDKDGKSRAWINGSPATATQLKEIAEFLVDIHGQHAWAALTKAADVRRLLDTYAGVQLAPLHQAWGVWRSAQKNLDEALAKQDLLLSERERLQWQLTEMKKLSPQPDEWPELNLQHGRLANAQALLDAAQLSVSYLDEDEAGVLTLLSKAQSCLEDLSNTEPVFAEISQELTSSLALAQDAVHSLQAYMRKTELDPDTLAVLDARLSSWISLARRFKRQPEQLPELQQAWQQELEQLDAQADIEGLEKACAVAKSAYLKEAKIVSHARAKAAPLLSQSVSAAMQGLGMEGGQFLVQLYDLENPAQYGHEDVQFLVAGHAGSSPKPIGKVASGGELSRIALALSVVNQESGNAPTVIFDEVDSGVGGAVAESVGKLMQKLANARQVLAVTHLPQVAAYAHQHFQVKKARSGSQTISNVLALNPTERENELARMLGGEEVSEISIAHARQMLKHALST